MIDVGGGFRDIYGAGVFDWCLDHDVNFDYCIGISAGSANLASYLARQRGRNYTFYMDYVFRKEYASLDNWFKTRNYVDLDYVYSTLSNSDGENPIDYETGRALCPCSASRIGLKISPVWMAAFPIPCRCSRRLKMAATRSC